MGARHLEAATRDPDGSTVLLPPYGELGIFIAATTRPMPPIVPMLLELGLGRPTGAVMLQLPVTSRAARDAGRAIWGMPKFMADLEFADDGPARQVHASEDGRTILDLRVVVHGTARMTRTPNVLFSVLDGRLIETRSPSRAFVQVAFRPSGMLELGDHPVADELRALGVAARPVVAGIAQQQRFLLRTGKDVGPAQEPVRYEGSDVPFGRFTSRYPDGTVVDHWPVALTPSASPAPSPGV